MATPEFNRQFMLNEEIIARFAGFYSPQDIKIETVVVYCLGCGFPIENEYEKEIGCHVECKGDKDGS